MPSWVQLYSSCANALWHQQTSYPFSEAILSWNCRRPSSGYWVFQVRLKLEKWSQWIPFAAWGTNQEGGLFQRSYGAGEDPNAYLDIDTLFSKQEATAFEVRCDWHGEGAAPGDLRLWMAVSRSKGYVRETEFSSLPHDFEWPDFQYYSQQELLHARAYCMCSPTSVFMATLHYHQKNGSRSVLQLAERVRDHHQDIYGHWSLNTAEAYDWLNGGQCFVARLGGVLELMQWVQKGPVVVSVQGALRNAAFPHGYPNGHLMVVTGWRASTREVVCADPAFPVSQQVKRTYALADFEEAWSRRFYLAYVFQKREEERC